MNFFLSKPLANIIANFSNDKILTDYNINITGSHY